MAVVAKPGALTSGFEGSIGEVVFNQDAAGRTIARSKPVKGRQGKTPENQPAKDRMTLIGEFMNRNSYNFAQFFRPQNKASNGSSEFSRLNAKKTGIFADPENPDFEKIIVSNGKFNAITFDYTGVNEGSGTVEVTVSTGIIPTGVTAKYYVGILIYDSRSILYIEAGAAVASTTQTLTVTADGAGQAVGLFLVDDLTLEPSASQTQVFV